MKKNFLLLIPLLLLFSCKRKDVISQAQADENLIKKYISENNLNATGTGSGLYYVINQQGSGATPDNNSTIIVVYKGYLTDGTVFDESKPAPTGFSTELKNTIEGWREGMPYFKKGGKGKLLVPSALGYGATATGKIPANSVLVFDVELLDVK